MEFGHSSGDVMKKRTSFGLSVADEKIKLIDILSEDDYFLVTSQSSISELERMEQKEKNILSGNCQESRPSFLRRSLAWDSAFFNNSGVLDPDELFFINNGAIETSLLPPTHEVRNRRSESESTPNDADFSTDWFELQPAFIESKSSKALNVLERSSNSGPKQIVQSSQKVDKSCKNKIKSDRTSIGKGISVGSEGKMKKESFSRRASYNKDFSGVSNLKMENKSTRTSLGKGLAMAEKSTSKSSSNLQPITTSLLSPKFSPIFSSTAAAAASTLSKIKPELKNQTSKFSILSVRKKGIGNISSCASPANSTSHFPSATLLSPIHKQRRSVDSKDVKEASNLQSSLQFPKQNGSLSAKTTRPSGLRPPSPHHRFFDESTPMQTERSRKMPQKKLKNPSSESTKRPETMLANTLATTGAKDSAAIDKQNGKNEVHFPVHQLDNLCRSFEAVTLRSEKMSGGVQACSVVKEEKRQPSSRMGSSKPSRRTPLADKTSKCNFSAAFATPIMEAKKEKLVRRASSVRYG